MSALVWRVRMKCHFDIFEIEEEFERQAILIKYDMQMLDEVRRSAGLKVVR